MSKLVEAAYRDRVALWAELESSGYLERLDEAIEVIVTAMGDGHALLIAGNGGSAADSQHFAAELVGRFQMERRALPALALTVDSSALTSIANDYSYETVFSRQVEALGKPGDVFVGISTSGTSPNVVAAARVARERGMKVVGMCGNKKDGGDLAALSDALLMVPVSVTALVQEVHEFSYHTICDAVERRLFDAE